MHRVRMAVRENRLVSIVLTDEHYVAALELPGRGWVVEDDGAIVAFATGNSESGNIWALFVSPEHEGRGHGRRLHDTMVEWLFAQGCPRLWLTTAPGTRAERFYAVAGWRSAGNAGNNEILFERFRPADLGAGRPLEGDADAERRES